MYGRPAEFLSELSKLEAADWLRLSKAAEPSLDGTTFAHPSDLVAEAIGTGFLASCGGPGRRWKKHVPLMAYLVMTIHGIASDTQRHLRTRPVQCEPNLEIYPDKSCPSPEQICLQEEEREFTEQQAGFIQMVLDHFKHDEAVQWVILGITQSVPCAQILERSGMSQTTYDSARKRWRRWANQLANTFPSGMQA